MKPDLIVIGGGIIGCSAAAFAAERGASVLLLEEREIGAGASGRNSGSVQYPFDPILAALHLQTLALYRELAAASPDFSFPTDPAGLLLLTDDPAAAHDRVDELVREAPHLEPRVLTGAALTDAEPMLSADLAAVRLETGYPIPPDGATTAMARRARELGAELRVGTPAAEIRRDRRRVAGVTLADGAEIQGDAVLVAAGPWSPNLVDPSSAWQPIRPTHGVTVQVEVSTAPTHILEEGVVHTINRPVETGGPGPDLESTFSMISVGRTSTVGSTFLPEPPDPEAVAPLLLSRGARFVPGLRHAAVLRSRVCTRPQSVDGRPFVGPWPGVEGLFVCVGHGPWGISTGPASAALAVSAILDADEDGIVPELRASRVVGSSG
ncbi:MAG TPA: FAD-dependent oxidoreductase [Candidatus Limnocylindria bacterium]